MTEKNDDYQFAPSVTPFRFLSLPDSECAKHKPEPHEKEAAQLLRLSATLSRMTCLSCGFKDVSVYGVPMMRGIKGAIDAGIVIYFKPQRAKTA